MNIKKIEEKVKSIFGDKVYGSEIEIPLDMDKLKVKEIVNLIVESNRESDKTKDNWNEIRSKTNMTKTEVSKVEKENSKSNQKDIFSIVNDNKLSKKELEDIFDEIIKDAETEEQKEILTREFNKGLVEINNEFKEKVKNVFVENLEISTKKYLEDKELKVETEEKDMVENDVRSRLRGFARTIPSFIMAYGDDNLKLGTFDKYVPEEVFEEVTGITIDQFKFLRDGGGYEENGESKRFRGCLFDEVVFNESIKEFLQKRYELADYFEKCDEDIFDYIPPQETNQIYTPKKVVKMMVDSLEDTDVDIYNDSTKTFIDIYMKSGLYITEIVKKLYNSESIINEYPDNDLRIKHILENQVYGLAPSEIIYKIATNFIFANFDETISKDNFKSVDVTPYVKEGKLQEKINELFDM